MNPPKKVSLAIPDKPWCHGCCYYSRDTHTCDFILIEHMSRPCKGGKGCKCKALENRRRIKSALNEPY